MDTKSKLNELQLSCIKDLSGTLNSLKEQDFSLPMIANIFSANIASQINWKREAKKISPTVWDFICRYELAYTDIFQTTAWQVVPVQYLTPNYYYIIFTKCCGRSFEKFRAIFPKNAIDATMESRILRLKWHIITDHSIYPEKYLENKQTYRDTIAYSGSKISPNLRRKILDYHSIVIAPSNTTIFLLKRAIALYQNKPSLGHTIRKFLCSYVNGFQSVITQEKIDSCKKTREILNLLYEASLSTGVDYHSIIWKARPIGVFDPLTSPISFWSKENIAQFGLSQFFANYLKYKRFADASTYRSALWRKVTAYLSEHPTAIIDVYEEIPIRLQYREYCSLYSHFEKVRTELKVSELREKASLFYAAYSEFVQEPYSYISKFLKKNQTGLKNQKKFDPYGLNLNPMNEHLYTKILLSKVFFDKIIPKFKNHNKTRLWHIVAQSYGASFKMMYPELHIPLTPLEIEEVELQIQKQEIQWENLPTFYRDSYFGHLTPSITYSSIKTNW